MKNYLIRILPVTVVIVIGMNLTHYADAHHKLRLAERDTMKFYSVSTEAHIRKGRTVYKVDGKRVSKETYDKYNGPLSRIGQCTPCYAIWQTKDEKLLYEGDMYTDCPVGYWKEYYPNGKVKVEGNYRRDSTELYPEDNVNDWCGIRHGTWTYFNQAGKVDSVVNYVDGKRVK